MWLRCVSRTILPSVGWAVPTLLLFVAADGPAPSNPLVSELIERGVAVGDSTRLKLPEPTLPDGLDAADARKALEAIADTNHPLEALLRKSVVAPFVLKISDAGEAGAATARRVDFWFVAYGDFTKLDNEEFWRTLRQSESSGEADEADEAHGSVLTPEELAERKIETEEPPGIEERYAAGKFTLFDKVQIQATVRSMAGRGDESLLAAAVVDDRFADDGKYPNQWRSITRDARSKSKLGPAERYSGAAGYVKATRLNEPEGAIFIEYHIAFDEPTGWFRGANLLRSKLPLVVQDSVRKFRRKLAKP